jgi:hypothetical protein
MKTNTLCVISGAILSVLLFSSSSDSILPLPIHNPNALASVEDEETANT